MDLSWASVATHLVAFMAGVLTTYAFVIATGDAVAAVRHSNHHH